MPKGTENFKKAIQDHLNEMAAEDPLFAESLEKEDKDINGCINYILRQVKKIGAQGYTDAEIFALAAHYYDEDDLKKCDPISCNIVVHHKPELTEQEKKELREQARNEVLQAEKKRMRTKKSPARKKKDDDSQPNLFSL